MNKNITDLIKFLCCIGIFLHHFYLRSPYVGFLGTTACVVFFFLSAYGISLSLEKHPVGLLSFLKKRLFKIYLPLLLVNVFFVFLTGYLCVGHFGIPIFNVFGDKIDFVQGVTILEILNYVIGLSKIDGVTWFLDVLFISYIVIWIVHQCKKKSIRIITVSVAYIIYVVVSAQITPPIQYGRIFDPLGVVCGVLFAESNRVVLTIRRLSGRYTVFMLFALIFILGVGLGAMSNLQGRYAKLMLLLIAAFSIIVVTCWSDSNQKKYKQLCSWLGGISYFVYLIHVKIANIVFLLCGEQSLLLSIIGITLGSVFLYFCYHKILKRL